MSTICTEIAAPQVVANAQGIFTSNTEEMVIGQYIRSFYAFFEHIKLWTLNKVWNIVAFPFYYNPNPSKF